MVSNLEESTSEDFSIEDSQHENLKVGGIKLETIHYLDIKDTNM